MNYYAARRRTSGKWDYTCKNNDTIYPIGYCSGRDPDAGCTDEAAQRYHSGGHETKEEAQACYKRYLLDNYLKLDGILTDELQPCKVCGEYTQRIAHITNEAFHAYLCSAHLNRAAIEELFHVNETISSY